MEPIPFTTARQNLLEHYKKAPHLGTVIDIIDAAYVAGIDDERVEEYKILSDLMREISAGAGTNELRRIIQEYLLNY